MKNFKHLSVIVFSMLLCIILFPTMSEAKSKQQFVTINMPEIKPLTVGDKIDLNVKTNVKSKLYYKVDKGSSYAYVKAGKLYTKKAAKIKLTVIAKPNFVKYYKTTKKTVTIKINPADISDVKVTRIKNDTYGKVSVTKTKGTTGYQFQYSEDKNFKNGVITKNQSKTTYQFKAKKDTTYYIRVRSFAKIKGSFLYGSWKMTVLKKSELSEAFVDINDGGITEIFDLGFVEGTFISEDVEIPGEFVYVDYEDDDDLYDDDFDPELVPRSKEADGEEDY